MSNREIERKIKEIRVNCNTYLGAWKAGNKEVRATWADSDALIAYFNELIANIKLTQQSSIALEQKIEAKQIEALAPAVKEQSANRLDFVAPDRKLNVELRNWQQATADKVFEDIYYRKMAAHMLLSGVGTGKTFMVGSVIQRLLDSPWRIENNIIAPYPIIVVTKATVVEQFKSDLQYRFGIDTDNGEVLVTNYEQLRSKFGEQFIKESTVVIKGEAELVYTWKQFIHPALIVWDECHSLKNEGSTQHKLAAACSHPSLYGKLQQIFMSATPFTRISDCRCFTIATRHTI